MTDYARRSARVLLIDADDRVFLFHHAHVDADGSVWITPGGGLDEGEDLRACAIRELAEETGLAVGVDDLGPHVAYASGFAALGWVNGVIRDDYFLHRVERPEISLAGMLDYETSNLLGHRWWSATELRDTAEEVVPPGLAPLLDRLAAGDVPDRPVELPWHF